MDPMLFLLLLALTLKLSSSACLTANLFDPWADDGWYGASLKITYTDGTVAYEVTQRDNVAANAPDPHSFCLICGAYQATIDGGSYDYSLSFAIIGNDGVEIFSGDGAASSAITVPCTFTCSPGSSPDSDDQCSLCAAGKFSSNEDYQPCSKCAPNTFSTAVGATSSATCIPCATGLASISGSSACSEPITTAVSTSANLASALQTVTALDALVVAATSTAYIHFEHFIATKPSAISCSTITSPPSCTFDGESTRRLFYIDSGDTATSSLVGLAFRRGKAPGDSTEGRGGGVWVYYSYVDISHCLFEENTSRYIYTGTFSGTDFAGGRGGGLAITLWSIATITHTTFRNNVAGVGGGIYVAESQKVTFENCQILDNQALAVSEEMYTGAYGGGVAVLEASTLSFKNTTISDNVASSYGGGVALTEESTLTMVDSFITTNTALTTGGGLHVSGDSSADVHNTKFLDNQVTIEADHLVAALSGGGAVAVNNPEFGDVAFLGCSFMGNADNTGKAADIFVSRGSATVDFSCPEEDEYWSTGLQGAALDTLADTGHTIYGPAFSFECLPACPSGKTRGELVSSTCSACDTGKYGDGVSVCVACPAGSHNPDRGGSDLSSCVACSPGTAAPAPATAACEDCSPGSYSSSPGANECTDCSMGKFNANSASAVEDDCVDCAAGTYSASTAAPSSSSCFDCSAGTMSNITAATSLADCSDCVAGTYSGAGSSDCSSCAAGKFNPVTSSNSADACQKCSPGTSSSSSAAACTGCAQGTYSLAASPKCTSCPPGTFNAETSSTTADACLACPAGAASVTEGAETNSTCVACSPGTFAPPGSPSCTVCLLGTFNPASSSTSFEACIECDAGSYSSTTAATSASMCVECSSGKASPAPGATSPTSCSSCTAGTYAIAASPTCTLCPPASFNPDESATSLSACSPCPPGTSNPSASTFASSCSACPAGKYSKFGVGCAACPPATYNPSSSSSSIASCLTCPTFLTSNGGSISSSECYDAFTIFYNLYFVDSASRLFASKLVLEGAVSFIFLDSSRLLASSANAVLEFSYDGRLKGEFASATSPQGLLHLPNFDPPQVAVASSVVLFFDLDGNEQSLIAAMPSRPLDLALFGADQILIATESSGVYLFDGSVPVQVFAASSPVRVAALPSTFLVATDDEVLECDLVSCTTFFALSAAALHVDSERSLVLISDSASSKIHAVDFQGNEISIFPTPSVATAMAFKSGVYAPLTRLTVPASATTVASIAIPISLRDRFDSPASPSAAERANFNFTAHGDIRVTDSLQLPHSIRGEINADAASVSIPFAGQWEFELAENLDLFSQLLGGHKVPLEVLPGPTSAITSTLSYDQTITAGETLTATVATFDVHSNPTSHAEEVFAAEIDGVQVALDSYVFSTRLTKAGSHFFGVTLEGSEELVSGAQHFVEVEPGDPFASTSTYSVSEGKDSLELRAFPNDQFNNTVTKSDGYAVSIDGGVPIQLLAPDFSHTHAVEDGSFKIRFMLDGVDIKGSPVIVKVAPVDTIKTEIAAVVFGALALVSLVFYRRQKANAARDIIGIARAGMEKVAAMTDRQKSLIKQTENLKDALRNHKHSETELAVMKEAMGELEARRKDELEEVLIKSNEVKVERLLGKGGFGVVNLATYRGQKTAAKQLLTINDESVKRFRFECFLMKNLRHPNIVKLVGVCWDDNLFACCLEFVENGSLEDWLRRTAGGKAYDPSKEEEKKKKKKKKKPEKKYMPLAETVFRGYDHDGNQYVEGEHTEEDKKQIASMTATMNGICSECVGADISDLANYSEDEKVAEATKVGKWKPVATADGGELELGAKCWWQYNASGQFAEAFARIQVSASPAQIFGLYSDRRFGPSSKEFESNREKLETTGTTQLNFLLSPKFMVGMSDRESLTREVRKKIDGGLIVCHYQVEDERKPVAKGAKRIWSEHCISAREKEGSGGKVSDLMCMFRIDPKLGGIAKYATNRAAKALVGGAADPVIKLKRETERLLGEYEPVLEEGAGGVQSLTWKGQLLNIATQCALGVQYLHHEQYWADKEVLEGGRVVEAGYRECIIHRDLKPDNMLLTKDWQLKLTDFGEARAINLNQTMTSVGTPIYVAPEVMAGNQYDATADSYSFGICLVAMIRGEKDVIEFYFQALRKTMKLKTKKGMGITTLNHRMYSQGWRPLLPLEFKRNYPKMNALIGRCWAPKKEDRPSFDEIVRVMQGEVAEEVRRKEEPEITVYSLEADALYHERLGKDEFFEEEEEEEGGAFSQTKTMISKRKHEEVVKKHSEVVKKHEEVLKELKEKVRHLEERERAREPATKDMKKAAEAGRLDGDAGNQRAGGART